MGNTELPLTDDANVPDTLQWWIAAKGAWRIRTYAIDHDIHTHEVAGDHQALLSIAKANNRTHYGEVIRAEYLLNFADCNNQAEVQTEFQRIGLAPRLEIAAGRFAFWKPDEASYSTKGNPRES